MVYCHNVLRSTWPPSTMPVMSGRAAEARLDQPPLPPPAPLLLSRSWCLVMASCCRPKPQHIASGLCCSAAGKKALAADKTECSHCQPMTPCADGQISFIESDDVHLWCAGLPGKTRELLAWLGTTCLPLGSLKGLKAVPLPNATRPLQALKASSAVHSALSVGFDKASTMGTPPCSAFMPCMCRGSG